MQQSYRQLYGLVHDTDSTYRRATITLALIVLSLTLVWVWFKPPEPDENFCIPGTLRKHVVVLVDQTDPWSSAHIHLLGDKIRELSENIRRGEKLSTFKIGSDLDAAELAGFSRCSPGKPGEISLWYRGSDFVQAKYREAFGEPLTAWLSGLKGVSQGASSPLAEWIGHIVQTDQFDLRNATERELILFSDMLQNSSPTQEGVSLYDPRNKPADFAEFLSKKVGDRLKGIKVQVYFVPLSPIARVKEPYIKNAWAEAFQHSGALLDWKHL